MPLHNMPYKFLKISGSKNDYTFLLKMEYNTLIVTEILQ